MRGNSRAERGLRTKAGNPWNAEAVLTVLRNRVYLGEIYFRGTWYRAEKHHEPLVDADVFEQAQQILIARGDDHAKRARRSTDPTSATPLARGDKVPVAAGDLGSDDVGRILAPPQIALIGQCPDQVVHGGLADPAPPRGLASPTTSMIRITRPTLRT